ncbi:hypothetical protein OSB04_027577 [Centaurea solstitialis]|uniref:Uncharacterized protein n=1 Tax=Centaurea solstitialis TaxID=347529 RepID=A0AA38WAD4_9ASTR|nr:hypothetical protein OSB04_027577 [Centaurea solstitialis]
MSHQQNRKWVDELIGELVKFLDVCGSTGDMLSHIKERNGDLSTENSITTYNCFRKETTLAAVIIDQGGSSPQPQP